MIAPGLRLAAAIAAGAHLVCRPRSGVVHVYAGPLTPSGHLVPRAGRTVCRARTRRLSVVEQRPSLPLDLGGRRVCRRCMPLLPAALRRCEDRSLPEDRAAWVAAFAHLSPVDVRRAAVLCRTVAETHQVGRVASMVHGEKPAILDPRKPAPAVHKPGRLRPGTPEQQERWLMHTAIHDRRAQLVAVERSPEARAAAARIADDELHDRRRTRKTRGAEAAADRLRDRQVTGRYVAPWERRPAS